MLTKNKPYRNSEFMKFLHEHRDLVGESCVFCAKPWTQLHHFGSDGGMGMKPSDLYLVRMCKTCADKFEVKMHALERDERWGVLIVFLKDALNNAEAYMRWKEVQ